LSNGPEEEVGAAAHDSEPASDHHQTSIVICLDSLTIDKGLAPRDLVIIYATGVTEIPPIRIERILRTASRHAFDIHWPYRHINMGWEDKFAGLPQEKRIAVQNYQCIVSA
jgi:hypothetical protein